MPIPKLTPGDPGYDWSTYSAADRDQPITDAKNFLAPYQEAESRARILEENRPRPEHSALRNLTDAGETIAGPAMFGAMVPSPASPFLAGGSAALFGAAGLRKLLAPEEDESRLGGAVDVGLSTLPYLRQAAGLVKGGRAAASAVETGNPEMVGNIVSRARTLMGGGETRGRSAQQAGWPLGKSSAALSMEPSLPHSYMTKPNVPRELRSIDTRPRMPGEINDSRPLAQIIEDQRRGPMSDELRNILKKDMEKAARERTRAIKESGNPPREALPDLPISWQQFAMPPEEKLAKLSKAKRPSRAKKVA